MSFNYRKSLLRVAFAIRCREVEIRARIAHHSDNPDLQSKLQETSRDIAASIEKIDAEVFTPAQLSNLDI